MSQKNPEWYKLIKLFKTVEGPYTITTGLTIPFLFGAYQILEKPFGNIDNLITSIIDSEIDKYPIVQRCHVIGQHVVMVEDRALCNKEYTKFPKIESKISNNALLISTNTNIGKTLDRICHNLRLEYEGPINRQEYSWSNGSKNWRRFHDQEIKLIRSIK